MKAVFFFITFLVLSCDAFARVTVDSPEMQLLLDTLHQTHHLPGIQVGIRDTETGTSWNFSSGYSDMILKEPLNNEHLMQFGSTTKSFIACLALLLEADSENGSLNTPFNIEQTVGHWLPQYPEWHSIKIKHLLNMTSGIYNYTEEESLFETFISQPKRIWQSNELVALAYSKNPQPLFPAGTKFSYSNTNYILAGMILEKASGLPLETLIQERILRNADYFYSTSYVPQTYSPAEKHNMSRGYAMHPDKHQEFYGQDITEIGLSWTGAAGGLIGTAADLACWPELLFSEKFLPKKQRAELESVICAEPDKEAAPLPQDSQSMGYGMGIGKIYDPHYGCAWTHTGGTLGYHTLFIYLPEKSVVISVIVNQIGPKIIEEDEQDVIFIAQQILPILLLNSPLSQGVREGD
jgi:D-alanyl-D-alanine carboxypeptidase